MKHKLYTAWISVDDELPYEDGQYLVAFDNPYSVSMLCAIAYFNGKIFIRRGEKRLVKVGGGNVKYWMALPSPPGNNERDDG